MKLLTAFTVVLGFMLIAISASYADDYYDDDDDSYEYIPIDDPNSENFQNFIADNVAEDLPSDNEPEDKDLDVRQYVDENDYVDNDNDFDDNDDDNKELVKRWTYKCEPSECIERCKKLLLLDNGMCGYMGKCYCRRVTVKKNTV